MSSPGYIDENGVYHRGESRSIAHDVNSQYKSWHHMQQRKQYGRDIVQPYKNGQPSREFIETYPEEAKLYFDDNQIAQAERKLNE